ncbi:SpoIIE family protein phosphatase, partial [bacterium]|nr:SpoIIE family protein phosphatase [bacterium]
TIHAQATRGYSHEALNSVAQKVSEGLIGWAIRHSEAVIVDNTEEDERYIPANEGIRSEMVVPIISGDQTVGSINLESNQPGAFNTQQLQFVEALASQAAVALERARLHDKLVAARQLEKELQIARSIQVALLPKRPPEIPGYDIAGLNKPSREVGGDYFDYIPITESDMGIVVADVAGKGVPAGLIMSGLRGALRSRVQTLYSVRQILKELNRFLYESTGPEAFVTLFYGVLNTAQHRFTYANAGHNPPMLLHNDGRMVSLTAGGPLLGVIPDAVYHEGTAPLEPGAVMTLFTDGIVEAGGEEGFEFGEQRVEELLREHVGEPACAVAAEMERSATRWAEEAGETDDRTVVVVKRL